MNVSICLILSSKWAILCLLSCVILKPTQTHKSMGNFNFNFVNQTKGTSVNFEERLRDISTRMNVKQQISVAFFSNPGDEEIPAAYCGTSGPHECWVILSKYLVERYHQSEVDFVIAHELGHINHRKMEGTCTKINRIGHFLALLSVTASSAPPQVRMLGQVTVLVCWVVLKNVLSRWFEYLADQAAAEAVGYWAGVSLLSKIESVLRKLRRQSPGNDRGCGWERMWSTHPSLMERMNALSCAQGRRPTAVWSARK